MGITCLKIRRVLFIIREEYERMARGRAEEGAQGESLHKLFTGQSTYNDFLQSFPLLKGNIMDSIQVAKYTL